MPDYVKIKDGAQVLNEQRERDVEKLAEKLKLEYCRRLCPACRSYLELPDWLAKSLAGVALEFCEEREKELRADRDKFYELACRYGNELVDRDRAKGKQPLEGLEGAEVIIKLKPKEPK